MGVMPILVRFCAPHAIEVRLLTWGFSTVWFDDIALDTSRLGC